MKSFSALWIFTLLATLPLFSQGWRTDTSRMYQVNPWVAYGIFAAGTGTNMIGIRRVQNGDPTPHATILALDKNDVNAFDRWVLFQDNVVDIRNENLVRFTARQYSDWALYGGFGLPFLLALDKDIRREWMDVLPMYLETQTITANLWAWGPISPATISRFRPYTYFNIEEFPITERDNSDRRASFYSGHVATAATGAMFFARVYCDYHPEMRNKWLVYAGASVVPVWSAYWRIRDLAHFPSDILVGAAIGTAVGVLVPHFHKKQRKKQRMALSAIYNERAKGLAMVWRF